MLTEEFEILSFNRISPSKSLKEMLPATVRTNQTVNRAREDIKKIIRGDDDRLLVVCGPCSIHDYEAALEYAHRLAVVAEKYLSTLCIIMRLYFEKPRTRLGWKGLVYDPTLDESFDVNKGLCLVRKLFLNINELGIGVGSEFLNISLIPSYFTDLIAWAAIGARTVESQPHRELASGLPMPVGFKNSTSGDVLVPIDAICAASRSNQFFSLDRDGNEGLVQTLGNKYCHLVLRGGKGGPNFDIDSIEFASQKLAHEGLSPRLMVDCSHANSHFDYKKQPLVAQSISEQIALGYTNVFGLMLESNLVEGKQPLDKSKKLLYGQSITDACIGWDMTADVLALLSESVEVRRSKACAQRENGVAPIASD